MRVLITGGAGFIGSHLAEVLLAKGDEVCILDDLSTGSAENIRGLKSRHGFQYYFDSVMNKSLLAELVDESDLVVHLAAAVGVRLIVESPVRTIETNVKGTELVLQAAQKKKKKVFIASTSEVYGKSTAIPFQEDGDLVMGPTDKGRWSYAASKALDEFLGLAYWKEKGVPVVVGRFFNTIGPRQTGRYGMVVPNFVRQAIEGRDITIYGDGSQSRCFTHVSDGVGALMRLAENESAVGEVYNIGGNQEITILELAQKVQLLTGSDSPIVFVPYAKAYEEGFEDMMRRVPDLSKINALIGYAPKITLDEILESVIQYQRTKLNNW